MSIAQKMAVPNFLIVVEQGGGTGFYLAGNMFSNPFNLSSTLSHTGSLKIIDKLLGERENVVSPEENALLSDR